MRKSAFIFRGAVLYICTIYLDCVRNGVFMLVKGLLAARVGENRGLAPCSQVRGIEVQENVVVWFFGLVDRVQLLEPFPELLPIMPIQNRPAACAVWESPE